MNQHDAFWLSASILAVIISVWGAVACIKTIRHTTSCFAFVASILLLALTTIFGLATLANIFTLVL